MGSFQGAGFEAWAQSPLSPQKITFPHCTFASRNTPLFLPHPAVTSVLMSPYEQPTAWMSAVLTMQGLGGVLSVGFLHHLRAGDPVPSPSSDGQVSLFLGLLLGQMGP